MHRVGLTRHCLSSGSVQLPFALRGVLPGGELLALDVERDEPLLVDSRPPRRLAGLRPLFEAHGLDVNDLLEIRLADGELRFACVRRDRRRAARDAAPDRASRAASDASEADREGAGPAAPSSAGRSRPGGVVDRIGSVTVRRLGDGGPRAGASGREDANEHGEAARERPAPPPVVARAERAPGDDVPVDPVPAGSRRVDPAPRVESPARAGSPTADAAPTSSAASLGPTSLEPDPTASDAPGPHPVASDPVVLGRPRSDAAGGFDEDLLLTPDALDDVLGEASGAAFDVPAARPEAPDADGAARPGPAAPAARAPAAAARREREEALSRAGDLRSRIVRWLLAPATPVIVPIERVQAAFGLPADVARDVVAGIVEDPPPSLRLTAVREDVVRLSRVTVEQEA